MQIASYIALVIYSLLFILIIYKSKFYQSKWISKRALIALLVLKLFFAMLYVFIHENYLSGGDIFLYFKDANILFDLLKEKPIDYLRLVFLPNSGTIASDLAEPINAMGFWQDTGAYMLVRFNAIVRLFSFGNIYIHAIFSGFFSFIGCFLIAKTFEENLKSNKWVLYSVFLSPSLLFWTSGIHKEFISVFALGLILYHFFQFVRKDFKRQYAIYMLLGFILFFFTRNYMLLALVPSLLAYFIHKILKIRFRSAVFFSLILLNVSLSKIEIPGYNKTGFEVIVEKRIQFEDLEGGNSFIKLDKIDANFVSLMKNSPKALFNTIARPHFLEYKNLFLSLAGIESFVLCVLILAALFYFRKLDSKEINFVIFMLLYCVFLLMIIGWIVPNLGAIIRYRSIALIILIPTLVFVVSKTKLS